MTILQEIARRRKQTPRNDTALRAVVDLGTKLPSVPIQNAAAMRHCARDKRARQVAQDAKTARQLFPDDPRFKI